MHTVIFKQLRSTDKLMNGRVDVNLATSTAGAKYHVPTDGWMDGWMDGWIDVIIMYVLTMFVHGTHLKYVPA